MIFSNLNIYIKSSFSRRFFLMFCLQFYFIIMHLNVFLFFSFMTVEIFATSLTVTLYSVLSLIGMTRPKEHRSAEKQLHKKGRHLFLLESDVYYKAHQLTLSQVWYIHIYLFIKFLSSTTIDNQLRRIPSVSTPVDRAVRAWPLCTFIDWKLLFGILIELIE